MMADIVVVMGAIMGVVGMIEVHDDVSKEHMLMMVVTHHQVLDAADDARDCGQHENSYQRDA